MCQDYIYLTRFYFKEIKRDDMRSIIVLMLLVVVYACTNQVERRGEIDEIFVDNFRNRTIMSESYFDVQVVPIKLASGQYVGSIDDVCIIDDIIYILDEMTATIYAVNRYSGQYVAHFSSRGKGPNEYLAPVALTSSNECVYVLDMTGGKVIALDKMLGPIGEFKLSFPSSDFIFVNDRFLFYNLASSEAIKDIVIAKKTGGVISSFNASISCKKQAKSNLGKIFSSSKQGDVLVSLSYDNILYEWNDDAIKPILKINFKDLDVPTDVDIESYFDGPYAFVSNSFSNASYIVTSFFYKHKRYYSVIDKKLDKVDSGVIYNAESKLPFFPQWQVGNVLIGTCDFIESQEFLGDAGDIAWNNNPVLLMYSFKN